MRSIIASSFVTALLSGLVIAPQGMAQEQPTPAPAAAPAETAPAQTRRGRLILPAQGNSHEARGRVEGTASVEYSLDLTAPAPVSLALGSDNAALGFALYAPGQRPGSATPLRSGRSWTGNLDQPGSYTLIIALPAEAAARGDSAGYRLTLSHGTAQATASAPTTRPAPQAAATAQSTGQTRPVKRPAALRQETLSNAAATAPRRSARPQAKPGRVAAATPAARPALQATPPMRRPAGLIRTAAAAAPNATATAQPSAKPASALNCALGTKTTAQRCKISLSRGTGGDATLRVTRPDGVQRVIGFRAGQPIVTEGSRAERRGGLWVVEFARDSAQAERYEIPAALISGK